MRCKIKSKKIVIAIMMIAVAVIVSVLWGIKERNFDNGSDQTSQTGQIFIYGEAHAVESILEKELQLWDTYYCQEGIRDLFIEYPYFDAQFLNIWMQSDNDDILEQVYGNWEGSLGHSEVVKQFLKRIKENYPETIFHGTDVGHTYQTTGEQYLEYLRSNGEAGSEEYKLAEEAIEQGKYYYEKQDDVYRENKMTENLIREFDNLDGASAMGIYGAAHTDIEAMEYTNTVPCMARQLNEHYGASIVIAEDLTKIDEPLEVSSITVSGKEYKASYFGSQDLSYVMEEYEYREFWRLENAYEDLKYNTITYDTLPCKDYPMKVEKGEVFVIDYVRADGSVERRYYRSDGNEWCGNPTTDGFEAD